MAARLESRLVPIVTIRTTSAATARLITASRSSANSGKSRWQCVSMRGFTVGGWRLAVGGWRMDVRGLTDDFCGWRYDGWDMATVNWLRQFVACTTYPE